MTYCTAGREYYPEYRLPLVYRPNLLWPKGDEGYYGVLLAEEGFVTFVDHEGRRAYPAPVLILLAPGHRVLSIEAEGATVHSMVFRSEAINIGLPGESKPEELRFSPEYFFLKPFAALGDRGYACLSLPPGLSAPLARLCDRVDEHLNYVQSSYWPCLSRSYFLEALLLLERSSYLTGERPAIDIPETGMATDRVVEYIHAHYAEPLTLDEISSRFATNRTSLNALFRRVCGTSVMAYLNSVRMEVAAALLRDTELPIGDIAVRSGFSDEAYFSRAFRKRYSLSPLAYRKSFPNPYHG